MVCKKKNTVDGLVCETAGLCPVAEVLPAKEQLPVLVCLQYDQYSQPRKSFVQDITDMG